MHNKTVILFLLAVLAVLAVNVKSQNVEHAPTVAQCQADQGLWYSKLEADEHDMSVKTLSDWKDEMVKCRSVDPQKLFLYLLTGTEANAMVADRMMSFILRHDLALQFLEEDAKGLR
jgi:hypothetical protein